MCGRFTLTASEATLDAYLSTHFNVSARALDYVPRYNIAPTQSVIALIFDGTHYRAGYLQWGLPFKHNTHKGAVSDIINARSESIYEKPMFKDLVKQTRCLILMDGYYEWKKDTLGSQPYYFSMFNSSLFLVAGLYTSWVDETQEKRFGTSLITTQAQDHILPVHDRMPVILNPLDAKKWLSIAFQDVSFAPYSDALNYHEVSKKVNSAAVDVPSLITKYNSPSLV